MGGILFFFTGTYFADTIQPLSSEKYVVEGKNVTLSCNYSTSTGTVNSLQWYRQYVGAKPEFLLLVDEYSTKSETDLRLYSKATKQIKRVDLEISSAAVSDSALYYCLLHLKSSLRKKQSTTTNSA
uniref:Ig-like domain-containing protein n=1 Tax=Cyprinus carpio TaxID=7962 RepID=A0A8C1N5W5_CYPCA